MEYFRFLGIKDGVEYNIKFEEGVIYPGGFRFAEAGATVQNAARQNPNEWELVEVKEHEVKSKEKKNRYYRFLGVRDGEDYIYGFEKKRIYPEKEVDEKGREIDVESCVQEYPKEWVEVSEKDYQLQQEVENMLKQYIQQPFRWHFDIELVDLEHKEKEDKNVLKPCLDFPKEIVEKMLERQVEQGNERDVTAFGDIAYADKPNKGFNWCETEEGTDFWGSVILNKDFDLFFEKYPKEKKEEKTINLFSPGDRLLCVKDEQNGYSFKSGKTYTSEYPGCITNERGNKRHIVTSAFFVTHFKKVGHVNLKEEKEEEVSENRNKKALEVLEMLDKNVGEMYPMIYVKLRSKIRELIEEQK